MNESAMDALTQRLDRLEWENRCLKLACVVVLIGLAAIALMGQTSPKSRIVEAEKFVLKDTRGKDRAVLGMGADGSTALALFDRNERARAGFRLLADDSPALVLYDGTSEKPRSGLTMFGGTHH